MTKTSSPASQARFLSPDHSYAKVCLEQASVLFGVHSPFTGYHNRPEANASSFLDGFYRTGDIGIWRDGLIYVVDRKKELIKYKGLQVAPGTSSQPLDSSLQNST